MSPSLTALVVVVVVLAVVVLGVLAATGVIGGRSRRLKSTFGPEYDRTVQETGSKQEAERELLSRIERRQELNIRDLDEAARHRYADEWRNIQTRFVDDPTGAVRQADELVTRVMRDRGYPAEDFDQLAADVSVDHADAIPRYRDAHQVMLATARDQAATDDLRKALVHYRELLEEMIGMPLRVGDEAPAGAGRPDDERDH